MTRVRLLTNGLSRLRPRGLRSGAGWFAWAAVAAVLVGGPALFTSARTQHYTASTEVVARRVGAFPAPAAAYVRSMLGRARVARALSRHPVLAAASSEVGVGVAQVGRRTIRLSASGSTPARAEERVNLVVAQAVLASRDELAVRAKADLRRLWSGRRLMDVSGHRRGRAASFARLSANPRRRLVKGDAAHASVPTGWADRLVGELPGPFTARPSPVWAAAAGALVFVALRLAAFGISRRRSPRRETGSPSPVAS